MALDGINFKSKKIMKNLIYIFFLIILFSSCETPKKEENEKAGSEIIQENPSTKITFNSESISKFWNKKLSEKESFFKVTFPRNDIELTIDGESLDPGFAYTSWIAYWPMEEGVRIMGDMVLLDSEIPKVIPYLKINNFNITAIHNHLLREQPRLIYMHFAAVGDAMELSKVMKGAYELTGTPIVENHQDEKTFEVPNEWTEVKNILGTNGTEKGNLLKYSFPRKEDIKINGIIMPKSFGIATGIGFQYLDKEKAAITGDFVLLAEEVNPVIDILSKNDIEVTALHNHMLIEEPTLYYMHFWAVGNPINLARSLKKALEKTNTHL